MRDGVTIRAAGPADHAAIAALVTAAFGQSDEARLVEALRADGDAAIELVAERGGQIVGHVLLSSMIAPFRALGLAPLSVRPADQRGDVGAALVEASVTRARAEGWEGIFLLGDPAYYRRFGFSVDAARPYDSPYGGEHFQLLPLTDRPLSSGAVSYAPGFAALSRD